MNKNPSPWWEYLEKAQGDMTDKQLAARINVSTPTISRWRHGKNPDISLVIQVARRLDGNIVAALVAAGILTKDEVAAYSSGQLLLSDVPLDTLLSEVSDRLAELRRSMNDNPSTGSERGAKIMKGLIR